MSLQSKLFRGDPKLEAAAVSDSAHIMLGASGPHVLKIQTALNLLDGAGLDPDSKYGPATAAAVLAYKRKRNIVNRSYQTTGGPKRGRS
jgi:peptidoglycan hydrolase-like protein with peptidoglycan-binding domain